jgi:lipopolysaccharide/colanic/teichoic acid biosynthesis glycosyltransferase
MRDKFKVKDQETFEDFKISLSKRIFDVTFSIFALLILSPIWLLAIIFIKISSIGPVFYISRRVGTGYDIFNFYKLRSMYVGSDEKRAELSELNQYLIDQYKNGKNFSFADKCIECEKLGKPCSPVLHIDGVEICENQYLKRKREQTNTITFFKVKNDPRLTRVGKIIRNFNIDEIPQFVNVIKGDMSIVGNRPLPLYEAEKLTDDQWALRFLSPAGITGLWQVRQSNTEKLSSEARKSLDNQYVLNASFWGDIKLILKTIPAIFKNPRS